MSDPGKGIHAPDRPVRLRKVRVVREVPTTLMPLPERPPSTRLRRAAGIVALLAAPLALGGLIAFGAALLDVQRWLDAPVRGDVTEVVSAPMRPAVGDPLSLDALIEDLASQGWAPAREPTQIGEHDFVRDGDRLLVADGSVEVADGRVIALSPAEGPTLPRAVLGALGARRDRLRREQIATCMIPALLASEDARFLEHAGVDPIGLLRAVFSNLRGGALQGGSTLTQQLAKNLFLNDERTLQRKAWEAMYAVALETLLSKEALLELYLSEVYLGHIDGEPVHGIAQAAARWFGKAPNALNTGECATIAGVLPAPNAWSPVRDLAAATERRNLVLGRMVATDVITEDERLEAAALPLRLGTTEAERRFRMPWPTLAALNEARTRTGLPWDAPGNAELRTTLQPHLQRAMEDAVDTAWSKLPGLPNEAEVVAVLLDARSGGVLALIGGRDPVARPFPRASDGWRDAASTVKPFVVLAAMQDHPALWPGSVVRDEVLTLQTPAGPWAPGNGDGVFEGPISLQHFLEASRNPPAVRLADVVGWPAITERLQALGFSRTPDLPSAAIGALPTTPLELAGLYTALATDGVQAPAHVLEAVEGRDQADPLPALPPRRRVADPASVAMVRHMLRGVTQRGTAKAIAQAGLGPALAAKTGTSQRSRDAWIVGFDGGRVLAVWTGLDQGVLGRPSTETSVPIWIAIAQRLGLGTVPFPVDEGVTDGPTCEDGRAAACGCPATATAPARQGFEPGCGM
jgi:membrane peptidoglycan carboxypeptidase